MTQRAIDVEILAALAQAQPRPLSPGELGQTLQIAPTTLRDNARQLRRLGLISRPSPHGPLSLTSAGRQHPAALAAREQRAAAVVDVQRRESQLHVDDVDQAQDQLRAEVEAAELRQRIAEAERAEARARSQLGRQQAQDAAWLAGHVVSTGRQVATRYRGRRTAQRLPLETLRAVGEVALRGGDPVPMLRGVQGVHDSPRPALPAPGLPAFASRPGGNAFSIPPPGLRPEPSYTEVWTIGPHAPAGGWVRVPVKR